MLETLRSPRFSLILALLAAAVCVVFAVAGKVGMELTLWRAVVAFTAVRLNQALLSEVFSAPIHEPAAD